MSNSAILDIRASFGAAFIGLLVSATLFGVTLSQTWMYFFRYYDKDPKALKFFIAFITIIDTLHTIMSTYINYWYLVLNYGNVENLDICIWAINFAVILSIIVSSSVQLFYARRVHIVSESLICPTLIVSCVAIAFCFGIYYTVREITVSLFSKIYALAWISSVGLSATALGDVLIAASMCWYLYRKRTGFARTDSIITTLMTYSINSGLLTSILGTATIITFAVLPNSLTCMAVYWVVSKCYVNSLLAMLNSRDHIRDRSTTDNPENAFNLSSIRVDRNEASGFWSKSRQPGVSVAVHNSTTMDFGRNKSDHDLKPTFEIQKAIPFQTAESNT